MVEDFLKKWLKVTKREGENKREIELEMIIKRRDYGIHKDHREFSYIKQFHSIQKTSSFSVTIFSFIE